MEVFRFQGSIAGRSLGWDVLASLLAAFPGHRDRGVKEARFTVLRDTRMPAILVECEFLSFPRQERFLASQSNCVLLARAIADDVETSQSATLAAPLVHGERSSPSANLRSGASHG